MNKDALCRAFCSDVEINDVPIGLAVRTPFTRPDGDYLGFYIRLDRSTGQFRIEDDGGTIQFLEAHGVDLDVESRAELLRSLLAQYGADFDDEEYLIRTDFYREGELGPRALAFTEMMVRLFDLLFTSAPRVARTFKEDLGELITSRFRDGHIIEQDAFLDEQMKDYLADYIIRAPDGRSLAVFAGTTEPKVLEALLFWREQRDRRIENARAMLVFEQAKPPFKARTMSRVHNSGLYLGSYENERDALLEKMETVLEHNL